MNERSEAAKAAMLHVCACFAKGGDTVQTKEWDGYRDLCDEGILDHKPITGGYAGFLLTDHGRAVAEYETLMARMSEGPLSGPDAAQAIRHIMARLGPPQLGSGEP